MSSRYLAEQPESSQKYLLSSYLSKTRDLLTQYDQSPEGDWNQIVILSPAEKLDLLSTDKSIKEILESEELNRDISSLKSVESLKVTNSRLKTNMIASSYLSNFQSSQRLPAAKEICPVTLDGWMRWASRTSARGADPEGAEQFSNVNNEKSGITGTDWNWMGYCHGWSAASTLGNNKPVRSVLATRMGKKILFTEGDLRSLLTLAYGIRDESSGAKSYFEAGGRCTQSSSQLQFDAQSKRFLDGVICGEGLDKPCNTKDFSKWFGNAKTVAYVAKTAMGLQQIWGLQYKTYKTGANKSEGAAPDADFSGLFLNGDADLANETDPQKFLLGRNDFFKIAGKYNDKLKIFEQKIVVFKDKSEQDSFLKNPSLANRRIVTLWFLQCRPINPATLHLALSEYLNNPNGAPRPFVADITFDAQVWNQPIVGYRSKIEDLISVDDFPQDPLKNDRAPNTTHIAKVHTKMIYLQEPKPKLASYFSSVSPGEDPDRQQVRNAEMDYTLEFKKDGPNYILIGGEWGKFYASSPRGGVNKQSVDFIWGFKTRDASTEIDKTSGQLMINTENGRPKLATEWVRKLIECSRDESKEVKTTQIQLQYGVNNLQKISYNECEL